MTAHQFERMLPWQIRAELARRPVAYIPLGTYEWHGEHLPVGLDALTSHGLCLRAAAQDGGIVLPPLHYGTGGGHGDYPWSIMMLQPQEIEAQLAFTLNKLKSFGLKLVVLFSGHFPTEQLGMIDRLAATHSNSAMKVAAYAVNRIEGLNIGPDHAGLFETSLLAALHRELVQLGRLPSLEARPLQPIEDPFGAVRHDPAHPLYGVFGPDPRHLKEDDATALLNGSVNWLVVQVRKVLPIKQA
ncbi:MAG: creatininase family protein [Aestuariivirga sp.]